MGLFDSVRDALGDEASTDASDDRSADETPRLRVRNPEPMDFRNKAVDAVQEWNCNLDFTLESLERLDAFARKQGARLDVLRDQSDDGGERVADMHTGLTIRAGSYVGEVLVRELDGEWTEDDVWTVTVPVDGGARTVDVFEVASHAFAEQPVFTELADELGADLGEDDDGDDEPEPVDLRPDFRPPAEEFAAFWDAYDLDFSPVSLARLDVLVDSEWADDEFEDIEAGGQSMDAKMYTELVKQLGCYYGEVLVRELDATWTRHNGAVVVVVPGRDGDTTVPIFDTAEGALRAGEQFTVAITTVAEDASREPPAVPTQAPTETPPDEPLDVDPAESDAEDPSPTAAGDEPTEGSPIADEPVGAGEEESTAAETESGTSDEVVDPASAATTDGAARDDPHEETTVSEPAASSPGSLSPAEIVGLDGADDEPQEPAPSANDSDTDDTSTAESATADQETVEESAPSASEASEQNEKTDEPAEDDELVESLIGDSQADDGTGQDTGESAESMDDAIPRPETTANDSDATAAADDDPAPESLDLADGSQDAEEGPTPDEIREDAVAFAATWPGHDLDFSPESLARLDNLVAEEYPADDVPDVRLSAATAADTGYLAARVIEAGGYFAEVLRRTVGGRWDESDDGLAFVVSGQAGEQRVDPAAVATECFRGEDSFEARYAAIRSYLSP
ncbi:MAG: hypothetical protein ABEI77_10115 [Halorientalis sp.]